MAAFAAKFPTSRCCHLYLRGLGTGKTTILDRASGEAGALADEGVQYFAVSASGCRWHSRRRRPTSARARRPTPVKIRPRSTPPGRAVRDRRGRRSAWVRRRGGGSGSGGDGTSGSGDASTTAAPRSASPPCGRLKIAPAGCCPAARPAASLPTSMVQPPSWCGSGAWSPPPRRHWRLVRTGSFGTSATGTATYELSALGPGTYRLNIHESGMPEGKATVRRLMVP